ncbi:MAG TPA: hypothetical protein VK955_07765 [Xanthobacteraceae bacterium]|nr:hypothetical protein [Xanthobacteraceae bacterium]
MRLIETKGNADHDADQQAHGIEPFGHLVTMPIALAQGTCAESVENLNAESETAGARPINMVANGQRAAAALAEDGRSARRRRV